MRLDKNKFIFSAIFAVIALAALQVPVNGLSGSSVKFTLFDLFAPIAGSFLGLGFGIFSVLTVLIVMYYFMGRQ